MDREVAREMLHQVRKALHDVDPAELYTTVSKPSKDQYDGLALAAMRVLTEGGSGAAAADAVADALREESDIRLGRVRKRLLKSRFTKIAL